MSSLKAIEPLSRREFLKMAGMLSLGMIVPPISIKPSISSGEGPQKNILIIVYDALSAHNVSLYSYPRDTMPNLTKLAERAVVYHNHLAGGNFTTPGTASMLTGVYPWTHRAFTLNETVDKRFISQNIFHAFPSYQRLSYTHNPFANKLLTQFVEEIDDYIQPEKLFFYVNRFLSTFFRLDDDIAYLSWVRTFERGQDNRAYSLFLSQFLESVVEKLRNQRLKEYESQFPRGLPFARDNYFLLEHATDFVSDILINSPKPFLGYFHFLPPHTPYLTRKDFYHRFKDDGFQPTEKTRHYLSNHEPQNKINNMRIQYDEYLLYVDHEFNRLYRSLEQSGVLNDTWLIFTSDHGEMFERATLKHTTATMYQPVIHVPLVIFEPGRKKREDVFLPTSGVDLLPTLLRVTGGKVPDWCEGVILPPYTEMNTLNNRAIYSMQIKKNNKYASLKHGSIVLIKEYKKLVAYFGYPELAQFGGELIEMYDLENDSEELHDLALEDKALAGEMLDEFKMILEKVNQPYMTEVNR